MITRSFPLLPFLVLAPLALNAGDWSQWRGPTLNGIAAPGQSPPLTWSETENVLWKSALPGQGHSSPALVGDRIFLTTSKISEETQSVLALDRASGSILWETVIAQGQLPEKIHKKNTHASPSPACVDGKVIVSFHSANHIQLAALDDEGNILWNKNAGEYRPQFKFGYGASPLIVGDLVVISSEFPRGGFIAAYRLSDGSQVWTSPRNTWTSYSSPILATFDGQEQILLPGNRGISAFDPATGNVLWSGRGGTKSTCATAVWDNNLVFWSGGFPSKETVAIQVGSGEVAWK
ncbi:MAG: PQQ-binding-like beta-propeller repeat protein, partial [Verrucomicrobiota bacterium]